MHWVTESSAVLPDVTGSWRLSAPQGPRVNGTIRFLYRFTWVYFLDKTGGATDRSDQKLRLVAGARKHPNVPSIPSFERY